MIFDNKKAIPNLVSLFSERETGIELERSLESLINQGGNAHCLLWSTEWSTIYEK